MRPMIAVGFTAHSRITRSATQTIPSGNKRARRRVPIEEEQYRTLHRYGQRGKHAISPAWRHTGFQQDLVKPLYSLITCSYYVQAILHRFIRVIITGLRIETHSEDSGQVCCDELLGRVKYYLFKPLTSNTRLRDRPAAAAACHMRPLIIDSTFNPGP